MTNIVRMNDNPVMLVVDDDVTFCSVLSDALLKRNFNVVLAHNVDDAITIAEKCSPEYAVIDLRMDGSSGLNLIPRLKSLDEHTRIVILTGYASIATAVEAIKLGANYYLTKPADADEIVAAFERDEGNPSTPITARPMSVNRLEWEHIQKIMSDCGGNISAAARSLGMHRRTLQRKLYKKPASI
jgi:two-component system, response regulator RegA